MALNLDFSKPYNKSFFSDGTISKTLMKIEEGFTDTLSTFYFSVIDNSFDYQYLIKQLIFISETQGRLIQEMKDEDKDKNAKVCAEIRKDMTNLKENFKNWKEFTIKVEENEIKLKKNQKIMAIKLAKQGLVERMKTIAKKRAGMKRQRALQEKKYKGMNFLFNK